MLHGIYYKLWSFEFDYRPENRLSRLVFRDFHESLKMLVQRLKTGRSSFLPYPFQLSENWTDVKCPKNRFHVVMSYF
jgi:hypothetical protein